MHRDPRRALSQILPLSSSLQSPLSPTETDSANSDPALGRRAVLQGVGGLVAAGAVARFHTSDRARDAFDTSGKIALMPARQAESLASSFGVVIHLNDQHSIYGNETAIVHKVLELGARHARSALTVHLAGVRKGFKALAAGGCRINATCQVFNLRSQPSTLELMNEVINHYGGEAGGVFSSFEGINEPNNNGIPWVAETRRRTIDLYHQAKARRQTDSIPVVGPALADTWTMQQDYEHLGDLSGHVDRGSIHMYPRGTSPSTLIDQHVHYARASYGNHDFYCTEGGYNNALNQHRLRPVPEAVAGVYGPRHLLEHYIRGNVFFRYELMDDVDPHNKVLQSNWGLVRVSNRNPSGWHNKPAFTAMKNFLRLIGDRGRDFKPAGLALKITGGSRDLRHTLIQKRNGTHYLCIWRDVSVYDAGRRVYTPVRSQNVTVTLQKSAPVKIYKPATKATPVSGYTSVRSFHLPLAGDVFVAAIG